MKQSLYRILIGVTALVCCLIAGAASAQPAPPPNPPPGRSAVPPPPPPGVAANLQQFQEASGTVQRFTLTPRGDIDGFLLGDGTEVHLPPHLSDQIAATIRPGDVVSVRGYRSPAVPLIVAATVTNSATNQSVVDQGPPPPGYAPPPRPITDAQQTSFNGVVFTALYGPAGDVNGALLSDGTIIRMPPPLANQYASLLMPGRRVAVQGWALNTAYGRVVETQTLSSVSQPMAPPPPR